MVLSKWMRPTWLGLERNKHKDKKLNADRGGVGKTAVIGAKGRESKQVKAKHLD